MALSVPSSLQDLVSQRLVRIGVSSDRTRLFFDVQPSRPFQNRVRYGYLVSNDLTVVGGYNLSPLLGGVILAVYVGAQEADGKGRLVFETNPTLSKLERSIIFIEAAPGTTDDFFVTESSDDLDPSFLLTEASDFLLLDGDGDGFDDTSLSDSTINRNIFNARDSGAGFFSIQEDDF